MNNAAFGTIAGLEQKHYGTSYGCVFEVDGRPYTPDYAAWAQACGAEGWRIAATDDLLPTLLRAVDARRPVVIDVPMENTAVPTPGKWDIERIYGAATDQVPSGAV
jgi:acetolactate synthase-1/2/3 large subunit